MRVPAFFLALLVILFFTSALTMAQTKQVQTLTGIVTSPDGTPVVGALVQLFLATPVDQNPPLHITPHDIPGLKLPSSVDMRSIDLPAPRSPLQTQTSDVNGKYIFYNVPSGNYTISIQQVTDVTPPSLEAPFVPKQLSASVDANVKVTGEQTLFLRSNLQIVHTFASANGIVPHGAQLPTSVTVFYATDRLRTPHAPATAMTYTNDWNGGAYLDYGVCSVNMQGIMQVTCVPLNRDDFLAKIVAALKATEPHKALIFSHGFNVMHDEAIRTGADFAAATKRVIIAYDWASAKNTALYTDDEDREAGSVSNAGRSFVTLLANNIGISNIALVGHSLGARATVDFAHVLSDAAAPTTTKLQPIVFFAGDVFVNTVDGAMPSLRPQAPIVISYDSVKDIPLGISLGIHEGNQRLGSELPKIALIDGISVIDATSAKSDWLGHGYLADPELLSDFTAALNGLAPANRAHLKPSSGDAYWIYSP